MRKIMDSWANIFSICLRKHSNRHNDRVGNENKICFASAEISATLNLFFFGAIVNLSVVEQKSSSIELSRVGTACLITRCSTRIQFPSLQKYQQFVPFTRSNNYQESERSETKINKENFHFQIDLSIATGSECIK